MKVDYISDLHLEKWAIYREGMSLEEWQADTEGYLAQTLPKDFGEILLFAGDFSHFNVQTKWTIAYYAARYTQVIFVFGNHDYHIHKNAYQAFETSEERLNDIREFAATLPNVTLLENFASTTYKGITIRGAVNWFDASKLVEKKEVYLNHGDYIRVVGTTVTEMYKDESAHLNDAESSTILLTHYPAIPSVRNEKFSPEMNIAPRNIKANVYVCGHCHGSEVMPLPHGVQLLHAAGRPADRDNLIPEIWSFYLKD